MSETQKHTKPNVPNLRFPGFSGEWERVKLGSLFDIGSSKRVFESQWQSSGVPFYRTREIVSLINETPFSSPIYIDEKLFNELIEKYGSIEKGDMLVTGVGTIGQMYVVPETNKFYFKDGNVIWFKHNPNVSSQFIKQLFSTNSIITQLHNNASITTVATYTIDGAKKTIAFIPSKKEQDKIASFLALIDQRIAIQNKVIEDYTTLEKEIQHQVFSRINAPHVPLSSISERVSERNSALESDNVLTISAREGLVSQLEFFNKSVASENLSNYYLLRKGDFAYNKSYSSDYPWGAIKHLERYDTGVLSPLYFCFRPNKEIVDTRYLQFFFDTKLWHKHIADIAVEGARNHGLLNMTVGDFYTMPILLPTLKVQKAIAEKLSAIRRKKVAEESIYRLFLQQKRYLLEKLFV